MIKHLLVVPVLIFASFCRAQVTPHLPFGSPSVSSLRSAIPIGDFLEPMEPTPERRLELKVLFKSWSDSIFQSSKNGSLYVQRGHVRMDLGAFRGALDDFEKARSLGYRKRETYFHLGVVNAALGERAQALAFFNICLKRDSTDAEALLYSGITKLYIGSGSAEDRCNESIPEFSKALKNNPSLRDALIYRGCAFSRLGQHEAAIDDFNKALEMTPGNPTLLYLIGQATLNTHSPQRD